MFKLLKTCLLCYFFLFPSHSYSLVFDTPKVLNYTLKNIFVEPKQTKKMASLEVDFLYKDILTRQKIIKNEERLYLKIIKKLQQYNIHQLLEQQQRDLIEKILLKEIQQQIPDIIDLKINNFFLHSV